MFAECASEDEYRDEYRLASYGSDPGMRMSLQHKGADLASEYGELGNRQEDHPDGERCRHEIDNEYQRDGERSPR